MKAGGFLWPRVSFAIATFNSSRTLEKCLSSIRSQNYPNNIEIVIGDGGSTDKTLLICKKHKARVISIPEKKQNAEYNKGVAANGARHEILVMVDHDNILPDKDWLKKMVLPLVEDPKIFGAGVLRFTYDKKMTFLDRYFALIGGTDPIPVFFNKSAHQSYLYDGMHLKGELISEKDGYYVVELNSEDLPALGGNGSLLRRKLLKKANSKGENFFHIDVHVDLAKKGYVKYAFVKESIMHLTSNNIIPFLKRRAYFIEKYYYQDNKKRRYSIFEPKKDKINLLKYIIYSATFVGPIFDSIRGYYKIPDKAWFLHPLMCFAMLAVYGVPTAKEEIKRVTKTE